MNKSVLIVGSFMAEAPLKGYSSGDLAERLRGRGWRVRITTRKQHRLARLVDTLKTTRTRAGDCSVALVDVFSGPGFFLAEAAAWMLRRAGKPYVLVLRGGNLPRFSARWPARVRHLLSSADAVTSPSAYLKEQLRQYCPSIRVIPNSIDVSRYPFRRRAAARPRLIWLRSFHAIYNPVMAIQVMAILKTRHARTQLVMVGPDKGDGTFQRTKREAVQANLIDHIRFPGAIHKSEVPDVLCEEDVFLNTTDIDNTPISVIEAMACGLCVVTTNVGGVPYLVQNGYDALTVPPRDAISMAQAVERVLQEDGLAGQLSANSREHAEQWDWSVVLPKWEALLQEAARATTSPH